MFSTIALLYNDCFVSQTDKCANYIFNINKMIGFFNEFLVLKTVNVICYFIFQFEVLVILITPVPSHAKAKQGTGFKRLDFLAFMAADQ